MSNNKIAAYQYGNTVRLDCSFHDFENNKIKPDLVKIIFYNYKYEIIFETVVPEGNIVGDYFYDYITESKPQRIYYEWYGEINGKPSLKRGEFVTKFI